MDVNFTKDLPEEILIQRERFEFLISIEHENCPHSTDNIDVVGNYISHCRLTRRDEGYIEPRRNLHHLLSLSDEIL